MESPHNTACEGLCVCVWERVRHRLWGTCNNRTMVPHKEIQWHNGTPQEKFYSLVTFGHNREDNQVSHKCHVYGVSVCVCVIVIVFWMTGWFYGTLTQISYNATLQVNVSWAMSSRNQWAVGKNDQFSQDLQIWKPFSGLEICSCRVRQFVTCTCTSLYKHCTCI